MEEITYRPSGGVGRECTKEQARTLIWGWVEGRYISGGVERVTYYI